MKRLLWALLLLSLSCGGRRIDYGGYDPQERRTVCHKAYRNAQWWPQEIEVPIWLAYEKHIGMHPNDYWGPCKEDTRPLPPFIDKSPWLKEFEDKMKGRRNRVRRR